MADDILPGIVRGDEPRVKATQSIRQTRNDIQPLHHRTGFEPDIASQQFVSPLASQSNLESVFADQLGKLQHGSRRGVDDGRFRGADQGRVLFEDVVIRAPQHDGFAPHMFGGSRNVTGFVESRVVDRNRKRFDWPPQHMIRHGDDDRRINPAAQTADHRDIGSQSPVNGLHHQSFKFFDDSVVTQSRLFRASIGIIDFPVSPIFDLGRSVDGIALDRKIVTGQQSLDTFEAGRRTRNGHAGENLFDTSPVWCRADHSRSEQGFDFGGKQQPAIPNGPVDGTNPKSIASNDQTLCVLIPDRDGKLASQLIPQIFPAFFPKVNDVFQVGVRRESMAAALKIRSQAFVIKELAVTDRNDRFRLILQRLLTVFQPDDTEATMPEPQPGANQQATVIRTSMDQCIAHCPQGVVRDRAMPIQID